MDKKEIERKIKALQKENQKKNQKRDKLQQEGKKLHGEIVKNIATIEKYKRMLGK